LRVSIINAPYITAVPPSVLFSSPGCVQSNQVNSQVNRTGGLNELQLHTTANQDPTLKLSVVFLRAAAASLVVEHREQHPQVQQGHGDEPHQNLHVSGCHCGGVNPCHTCVCSHTPGEGANLSSILRPPQALQLGKLTACTDECAQVHSQIYDPLLHSEEPPTPDEHQGVDEAVPQVAGVVKNQEKKNDVLSDENRIFQVRWRRVVIVHLVRNKNNVPDELEEKAVEADSRRCFGSHQYKDLRELQHHAHKQSAEVSYVQQSIQLHCVEMEIRQVQTVRVQKVWSKKLSATRR